MNPLLASVVGALSALAVVAVVMAARLVYLRQPGKQGLATAPPEPPAGEGSANEAELPAGAEDVLAALRSTGIVVDPVGRVIRASTAAAAQGLVRNGVIVHPELRHLHRLVGKDGVIREVELDLPRGPLGTGRLTMVVRVARMSDGLVLMLVDDRTQARRVEEIRRDFVVNVSHELKTPVGGISLLAEAVADARDDPEAVARFAARMTTEADRLSRLVKEIVDLSRLQSAEGLAEPELVDIAACAEQACDQSALTAQNAGIDIHLVTPDESEDAEVWGDQELITTAIRNLIVNAIAYSDAGTRVVIAVMVRGPFVEVSVTDQGQGIALEDQERIFERFYRVDAARSRQTGGTGLGLSIVKHVCANHGGDVTVWSEPGRGSTFTMRLPAASAAGIPERTPADPTGPADRLDHDMSAVRDSVPPADDIVERRA